MIKQLYSILDKKSEIFSFPFEAPNELVALRHIVTAVKDNQTHLFHHPEDYTLYLLGEFNDETGEISAAKKTQDIYPDEPEMIIEVSEIKRIYVDDKIETTGE